MRQDFQVLGNLYIPNVDISLRYPLFEGPHWGHRVPRQVLSIANRGPSSAANHWHHDQPLDIGLILWSNMFPTEIRLSDGRIVTAKPFDVVLLDNANVHHRTPEYVVKLAQRGASINRYLIRGIYDGYPSDDVISEWKNQLARKKTLVSAS